MLFQPKLLVTGANGFIGGALTAKLFANGQSRDAIFLIRSSTPEEGLMRLAKTLRGHGLTTSQLLNLKLDQILCGDLNVVNRWIDDPRLKSVENVVSSAAVASFGNHPSIWPTNVDGVLNMAHGLSHICKLKRFIHIGTAMACGLDSPNPVPEGYDGGAQTHHFLEYTYSKYEVERRLKEELPNLPLIIARPSIVVGHTKLGCKASGSIFWVFRMALALKAFPCALEQRIDVVPVDYCADALYMLLTKPILKYSSYHISAGEKHSSSFAEIEESISEATGKPRMKNYQQKSYEQILQMRDQFKNLLGECNRRIVAKAIKTYGNFSTLELAFDNSRLIEEGMDYPTPLAKYAGLCELTSQGILISEQMKFDYK
ncbi:SDR family oxidoreductase [Polynucleobacter sp. CS-Odin-A6]|uniref:SDR family oxidoreductase n=1 Tax=Polynucleobacter sp. CS-Odin-A6 TaxID=2689106 RepID=UPI001C0C47A8|nr:SDR family oxidoreductase [Polynucleobacter sp. CS-Odin-A6]MBU3621632.1 SDR family oxidoreductase [Polynucleobacter sp. CS-Odin-A6]